MGWRIVSLLFLLMAIAALPFWPYPHPWPNSATLAICGFCFFVAALTFLVSIFSRHGSALWRGRGHS
jgi:hypothetical protein